MGVNSSVPVLHSMLTTDERCKCKIVTLVPVLETNSNSRGSRMLPKEECSSADHVEGVEDKAVDEMATDIKLHTRPLAY